MRNSLRNIQYLLFALMLFALTACGTSSNSVTPDGPAAKMTVKTVGLVSDSVAKVRLTVTGAAIPTAKQDFAGKTGGTIEVYPGSGLIVSAQALDANNAVLFEGFAADVTVAAGTPVNVAITMNAPVVKAADSSCLGCHESTRDITGQNLVADYKQSGHYTNLSWTANAKNGSTYTGCAGCHGTQHNDVEPSASGRCYECHAANLSLRHSAPGVPLTNARYLSPGNNNCSACHEPHNPINGTGKQERKDWAASGHGDVNALAWMDYDFTTRASCNACHTPGGFVQAIGSNWANTNVIAGTAMQPLTCDGCHSSNDFANSVRTLSGGYKAGMGGYGTAAKGFIQYPNVGESNVCIPCHASRENGDSIKATVLTTASNTSFKNPHYLAAAAVFYGKGGFKYYGAASTTVANTGLGYPAPAYTSEYGAIADGVVITGSLTAQPYPLSTIAVVGQPAQGKKANWQHGRVGMENYSTALGTTTTTYPGKIVASGDKGQCVACHLGPKNGHSFGAYEVAKSTWSTDQTRKGCYGCHSTEDMTVVGEEEKLIFDRTIDFLSFTLKQFGINYNSAAYPYFFQNDLTTAFTAWNTPVGGSVQDAQQTMGAAMNLKLLTAEKGSHVHNRTFMKQLIFDSVQYLQFGAVTYSNSKFPATTGNMNLENVLKFSAYSSAVTPAGGGLPTNLAGNAISIAALKNYIITTSSVTNPIAVMAEPAGTRAAATYGELKYFRK
ncbi:MAG: hypothetical protein ACOYL3_13070 [Desulfuromonadaceae bacterium]